MQHAAAAGHALVVDEGAGEDGAQGFDVARGESPSMDMGIAWPRLPPSPPSQQQQHGKAPPQQPSRCGVARWLAVSHRGHFGTMMDECQPVSHGTCAHELLTQHSTRRLRVWSPRNGGGVAVAACHDVLSASACLASRSKSSRREAGPVVTVPSPRATAQMQQRSLGAASMSDVVGQMEAELELFRVPAVRHACSGPWNVGLRARRRGRVVDGGRRGWAPSRE